MAVRRRRLVVVEEHGHDDDTPLQPDVILSFHDLCLAKVGDGWFRGRFDTAGSIICWASYGPDLGEAIRGR